MSEAVDLPAGLQAQLQHTAVNDHQHRMAQAGNSLQIYNNTLNAMTLQKYNEKSPSESVGDVKVFEQAKSA